MSLEEGKTVYLLSKQGKCKYMANGETKEAISIDLLEPAMSHMSQYARIKQTVNGLIMDMQKLAGELDPDAVVAGTEIKKMHEVDESEFGTKSNQLAEMILFGFGKSDSSLAHFVDDFRKMAVNKGGRSICVVDGVQPMTDAIWNTLHPDDAIGMAVRWAAFFTMPSDFQEKAELGEGSDSALPVTDL